MDIRAIWSRHRERPFRPYQLRMINNRMIRISHPRSMLISEHRLTIAIDHQPVDPELEMPDDVQTCSPLDVIDLADITSPS